MGADKNSSSRIRLQSKNHFKSLQHYPCQTHVVTGVPLSLGASCASKQSQRRATAEQKLKMALLCRGWSDRTRGRSDRLPQPPSLERGNRSKLTPNDLKIEPGLLLIKTNLFPEDLLENPTFLWNHLGRLDRVLGAVRPPCPGSTPASQLSTSH